MAEFGVATHNAFQLLQQPKKEVKKEPVAKSALKKAPAAAPATVAPTGPRPYSATQRGGMVKGRRGPAGAFRREGQGSQPVSDFRGKRVFDRRSGDGRPIRGDAPKGGFGRGNWGSAEDVEKPEEVAADGVAPVDGAPADGTEAPADAVQEPKEDEGPPVMTLEEYLAQKKRVEEDSKLQPRAAQNDEKQWKQPVREFKPKKKALPGVFFESEEKEDEEDQEEDGAGKKKMHFDEFVKSLGGPIAPAGGSFRGGPRGGRGGFRGGRGRGGAPRGGFGGRGGRGGSVNVMNNDDFPALGK